MKQKLHWSGVAFIDKPTNTMSIPTLDFEGSVGDGYKLLDSMNGNVTVIIDDIPAMGD